MAILLGPVEGDFLSTLWSSCSQGRGGGEFAGTEHTLSVCSQSGLRSLLGQENVNLRFCDKKTYFSVLQEL